MDNRRSEQQNRTNPSAAQNAKQSRTAQGGTNANTNTQKQARTENRK